MEHEQIRNMLRAMGFPDFNLSDEALDCVHSLLRVRTQKQIDGEVEYLLAVCLTLLRELWRELRYVEEYMARVNADRTYTFRT